MFSTFERLLDPFPSESPSQPPNKLFAFCRHYSRGSEFYLIIMGLLSGAIAVMEIYLFSFLGQLVDLLTVNTPETLWSTSKNTLIMMGVMVVIALPLTVAIHSMLLHQTFLGNYPMGIRWQAHRYLVSQSTEFFQNEFAGRLATKVMQTALSVRETIIKLIDVLLYVVVYFSGIVVLVGSLDLRLAIPFFLWICGYVGMMMYFLPRLANISAVQADARSDMTGRIVDTYTNITSVKLFSHSQREAEYAKEGMERFLHTVYPQMRYATQLSVGVWVMNALLTFSVATLSIWLWGGDLLTAGAIAAAIGLVLRLFGMSQWVMWEISALFENIGTVRDGMNTLTLPRFVQDAPESNELSVNGGGKISFDDVSFKYQDQITVFNNFNLTINPGEKIGLVGRSGAGKSTLVNILLRFYDLESGAIKIDHQNVALVKQESLRANIGMVTQDTSLLHRSVHDNIAYGKPRASREAVIEAAKLAHAHEFILDLKDAKGRSGYDAHVGERGVKLSGGQRQRIAIARVLLKNAPILILDEATSALDSEVEAAIQENLALLMRGKTVIAIAHRLSTIAAMDRLVVLDQGKIVEQGNHEELLNSDGIYAQLWTRQSGGFLAES